MYSNQFKLQHAGNKKARETTQETNLSTEPDSEIAQNLKSTKINMLKGLVEKEDSVNKRRILGYSWKLSESF